ncbi:hypothetical protein [Spongiimicrobium salis]|uniref:hypothetical protein n=1 Tax=Spongiimicrobium salis TaxID=1667022 RepID=UPI00374D5006
MKKVIFTAALAFGCLSTILASTPIILSEIMEARVSQDFKEIKIEELPETITAALAKDYPGATIDKAYVNEEEKYKLEVTREDGTSIELYADAEGNWIEG